jgi:alkanesulfonate monooxygenase SsuD/methylene tetrahydromethanopterin reductase-like flavin-dependent oxidoreductase (luciferase family)
MKFGAGYLTPHPSPEEEIDIPADTIQESYQRELQRAQIADSVGYDSVWVAEHHNARENYFTQPMTMCAALSQITDLTVGTGITIGGLWNPSRLAEEAATVDVLSQGNLQVGMGLGYNESEFTGYGIPKGERLPRMKDSIEICKKGWSGEPFSYDGERFSSEEIHIEPKPPQGTDLPILIGALAEPRVTP